MRRNVINVIMVAFVAVVFGMAGCGGGGGDAPQPLPAPVANLAPVANAGTSQDVSTGAVVTLDGSASSDANSDLLTYSWAFTSKPTGSSAALSNATVVNPTFTADVAGAYGLNLVVNDGKVNSVAATVTVTASASVANTAPVANAGTAQSVVAGAVVTLDGSASSDADSDLLTYRWAFTSKPAGSTAALSSATVAKPSFAANVVGAYVLNLVVNDGKVNSAVATVTVTASVGNAAPVANAGTAQSVVAGVVVTLDGSASSDANGDLLTYSWAFTSKPAGSTATLSSATVAKPSFAADVAGAYVLNLVVNDGTVNSVAATVTVTASIANAAPVANAGTAQSVVAGVVVTLDGSASSDANGDLLAYRWAFTSKPAGSSAALSSATVAKPSFIADVAGTYVLNLVVNDGTVNSVAATVTVAASVANAAPVANAGTAQSIVTGTVVTLDGSASSDANGDPLTNSWAFVSKPAGSTAALSSATVAKPTFVPDKGGTYVFKLVVNDGKVDSEAATVTVTANVARNGMIVTLTSFTNASTGTNNEYTFNYTQKNETSATLDEVRLKFYFTDGTTQSQADSFGTLVPGETKSRSYTFTVLSTKDPSILEFDHDNDSALSPVPGSIQIPW